MKLKHRMGDFRVRELLEEGYLSERGPHRVYRVTKRKLTTPEAAAALAREVGCTPAEVSVAGLKDRQGITIQHMSVLGGELVRVEHDDLRIEPVGFAEEALQSHHSSGNAFEIRVRGLSRGDVERLRTNLEPVRQYGVPNYFDDQRFGNLRHGQGWVQKLLFEGRFDAALRAMLATQPKPQGVFGERPDYGGFERGLDERWGDWEACLDLARKTGKHRSVFEHLVDAPLDIPGAFRFVGQRLRLIHAFAWQSHLWNRAVAELLRLRLPLEQRLVLESLEGPLLCHGAGLPAGLDLDATFPLPADGLEQELTREQRDLLEDVLAQERLVPDQMRVRDLDGFALKAEDRPLFVLPQHLRVRPAEPDTEERGALSIKLAFELPRGAYATLVVKRLFSARVDEPDRPPQGGRANAYAVRQGGARPGRGGRTADPAAERDFRDGRPRDREPRGEGQGRPDGRGEDRGFRARGRERSESFGPSGANRERGERGGRYGGGGYGDQRGDQRGDREVGGSRREGFGRGRGGSGARPGTFGVEGLGGWQPGAPAGPGARGGRGDRSSEGRPTRPFQDQGGRDGGDRGGFRGARGGAGGPGPGRGRWADDRGDRGGREDRGYGRAPYGRGGSLDRGSDQRRDSEDRQREERGRRDDGGYGARGQGRTFGGGSRPFGQRGGSSERRSDRGFGERGGGDRPAAPRPGRWADGPPRGDGAGWGGSRGGGWSPGGRDSDRDQGGGRWGGQRGPKGGRPYEGGGRGSRPFGSDRGDGAREGGFGRGGGRGRDSRRPDRGAGRDEDRRRADRPPYEGPAEGRAEDGAWDSEG